MRIQKQVPATNARIRYASRENAHPLWLLRRLIGQESRFLRLSPADKQLSVSDFAIRMADYISDQHMLLLVAEIDGRVVGYLQAALDARNRCARGVSVGVLKEYWGHGLGGLMLSEMETWSIAHNATRIEMNVMLENDRARLMYERRGYVSVGEGTCTLYDSAEVVRELYLLKSLSNYDLSCSRIG